MSPQDLRTILAGLPKFTDNNLLVGLETSDDAGVYRLNDDTALIQTVDFFTPIVDDPYAFGQIAAANALSDIYAMGGRPLTAMNIVCFPKKNLRISVLEAILQGGVERIKAAGAVLAGGHSVEDKEIKYGLSVTGIISPKNIKTNANAKPGDALILTKPLGTGIISTAIKKDGASESDINEATSSMIQLNNNAAELMVALGAHAATDVTGFGLMGHSYELAIASKVDLTIKTDRLPFFTNSKQLALNEKYLTKGNELNRQLTKDTVVYTKRLDEATDRLLYDAQTSGGLLITIENSIAGELLTKIREAGYHSAAIIGHVGPGPGRIILE